MSHIHTGICKTHVVVALALAIDWGSTVLPKSNVSAIYIASFINELQLFGVVFIVPHVAFVIVGVSDTVKFCIESLLNLGLGIN